MVGNLLRLKLAHLGAAFKRSAWAIVGTVIGGVYGLGMLSLLVLALLALHGRTELVQMTAVGLGSLIALAWLLIPLVASGADATLDPDRLALYPLRPREIVGGQLAGSLIGIVGPLTLLALLAPAVGWSSPAAAAAGVVCSLLGYALVVVCSRLVSAFSMALRSRRFVTETIGAVMFVVIVAVGPLLATLGQGLSRDGALERTLGVLAWTPLGVAWAVPGDLAQGAPGLAAARAALLLVYLAAGLLLWNRVVAHQISHIGQGGGSSRRGRASSARGIGLFGVLPGTPAGAVAARTVLYLFKDPRFNLNLIMVPALFLVFWLSSQLGSGGLSVSVIGPVAGIAVVWVTCYAVSYDNTAFSLHVTAPLRGRDDRWGRVLGFGVVFLPLVVAASVAGMLVSGSPGGIPANLGLSLGFLLTGLGVGAVISVSYAYPVAPPGGSPWKTQRNGAGFANMLAQMAGLCVIALLAFPAWAMGLVYLFTGAGWANWLTLVLGVLGGSVVLWLGVRIGGTWYERRAPELYGDVARFT